MSEGTKRMNERKGQSDQNGQAAKSGWDGSTPRHLHRAKRLAEIMLPSGTETKALWFTQKAIKKRMLAAGVEPYKNLMTVIYHLVKRGYLERANAPSHIGQTLNGNGHKVYLYRRTNKRWKEKHRLFEYRPGSVRAMEIAQAIYYENHKLPKWFRDMMFF